MPNTSNWRQELAASLIGPGLLADRFGVDSVALSAVTQRYPMRIPPYYLGLIRAKDDPIWRQVVPDAAELKTHAATSEDPLNETGQSPAPGIIHRYPDRVIFTVSNQCAAYCRFCLRKRNTGLGPRVSDQTLDQGLAYIRENRDIREVILSGGDPLMLSDDRLADILRRLVKNRHIKHLRIHTRLPCTLPQRITKALAAMLGRHQPLFVMVHFNHPRELTPAAVQALARLADIGIPLGSQTVLLRGVNDTPQVMAELMRRLVQNRVRPYYLHHPDLIRGTDHLRCTLAAGLRIMEKLRGHLSGVCVPQYMLDLPGGGGKVPLLPDYILRNDDNTLTIKNYRGKRFLYALD